MINSKIKEIIKNKNLYQPEKIDNILYKLKLKPTINPIKFISLTKGIKHRYYTPCFQNGKKRFFYCLLKKNENSRKKFLRELKLARFLIKNKSQEIFTPFPSYLKTSSLVDAPVWLLLDWIPHAVLEDKKNAELSLHQLGIKETRILSNIIIKINNLLSIKDLKNKLELEKFDLEIARQNMINSLMELEKNNKKNLKRLKLLRKKIIEDLKIWDAENHYFCHGDLHLGNIVYKEGIKPDFKIIDWELYCINNFAYDVSFLFSRLWREPKIRKNLITSYVSLLPKNKIITFRRLFKINLLYFALTYGLKSSPLEFTKEQIKKRQAWFKKLTDLYLKDFENYLEI